MKGDRDDWFRRAASTLQQSYPPKTERRRCAVAAAVIADFKTFEGVLFFILRLVNCNVKSYPRRGVANLCKSKDMQDIQNNLQSINMVVHITVITILRSHGIAVMHIFNNLKSILDLII